MEAFFDTLKVEESACPDDCSICRDACANKKGDTQGCAGIKTVHLPEINAHTAITCNQCGEPVCADHCPTGAITKNPTDGIVRINQDKCLVPFGGTAPDGRVGVWQPGSARSEDNPLG